MSKFIKKQQYNSIDENIYDEFVDIDSITIEEIDKEIEDFYIDKEKINNIKFEFDKKLIIKQGGNRNRTYARSFQPLEAISRFEHISEAIKKLLLKDI